MRDMCAYIAFFTSILILHGNLGNIEDIISEKCYYIHDMPCKDTYCWAYSEVPPKLLGVCQHATHIYHTICSEPFSMTS